MQKGKKGNRPVKIEATYRAKIISTAEYLKTNYAEDQLVNIVNSHERNKPM
jgi:hypothetical protein